MQETLCNMKCKLRALPKSRSETIRDEIRTFFEERKPYDFLQLCYYQVRIVAQLGFYPENREI